MKSITPLTIDEDVKKEAKAKGLNMSAIAEEALRESLGHVEVNINTTVEECEFCGSKGKKATAENPKGLIWLWPDEKWMCERCFYKESIASFMPKK